MLHADPVPLAPAAPGAKLGAGYGKLPLSFEPNQGQSDRRVKFLSRGHGYSLFLTATEAVLALSKRARQDPPEMSDPREPLPHLAPGSSTARRKREAAIVRVGLVGANRNPLVEGIDPLPGTANYFIGKDPQQWHTRIPTYSRVRYGSVYPGIDLVYHGSNQRELEYDFVVAPGADPARIALRFDGARRLTLNGRGDLIVHVAGGELIEHAPMVFQNIGGVRRTVASRYRLRGSRQAVFEFAAYDRTRAMVVDPVLAYATYLGGSAAASSASAIAVDAAGNAYVTGSTGSALFPATAAAFQSALEGSANAFVTKLNASGAALIYSTYLGGSEADTGAGIAVDAAGNAYVTGSASSQNFPTTAGAFQTALKGITNAFVAELNPSGTALVYSTYLGGSRGDSATGIAVDSAGNAHVTGYTKSADFPTTADVFQTTLNGGANAFVAQLGVDGAALVYSTYLGGSMADNAYAIAVDSAGNTYVSGDSTSPDFPNTVGAFQPTLNGIANAFVVKLNAGGTALAYATYLGGSKLDFAYGIAVDSAGNAYVSGETRSDDFPTTAGAFQTVLKGTFDAFVTEVNPNGTALNYSTYFGGTGINVANAAAVDSTGNAYVTGYTTSTDLATTPGAFQTALNGDVNAFMCEFNSAGTPVYSTYLGGSGTDSGNGIAVDSAGDAYVTGYTTSTDFPVTASAFQSASQGYEAAFVAKFPPAAVPTPTPTLTPAPTLTPTPTPTPSPTSLSITPPSVNFGQVGIGTAVTAMIKLKDIGKSELSGSLSNSGLAGTPFSVAAGSGAFQLARSQSKAVTIKFKPASPVTSFGSITITSNDPANPAVQIGISGTGVPGALSVPAALDFPVVKVHQSSSRNLSIKNTGLGVLHGDIDTSKLTAPFSAKGGSFTLAHGKSRVVTVKFVPVSAGMFQQTILITSDGAPPSSASVSLIGTGQ